MPIPDSHGHRLSAQQLTLQTTTLATKGIPPRDRLEAFLRRAPPCFPFPFVPSHLSLRQGLRSPPRPTDHRKRLRFGLEEDDASRPEREATPCVAPQQCLALLGRTRFGLCTLLSTSFLPIFGNLYRFSMMVVYKLFSLTRCLLHCRRKQQNAPRVHRLEMFCILMTMVERRRIRKQVLGASLRRRKAK